MPASIAVDTERCMRVRFPGSTCERCVGLCPENAISLDPKPAVSDSCTECGLCRIACPTEVFETDPDLDELLLRQARSLLELDGSPIAQQPLIIRCHETSLSEIGNLALPCLGSMSENAVIGAALLGFQKLILVTGSCAQCSMSHGSELIEGSMRISDLVVRRLGLHDYAVERVERPKTGASYVGRRQVFSTIGNRFRTGVVVAAIDRVPGFPERRNPHQTSTARASPRRALLLRLLEHGSWGDPEPVSYEATLPWGMLSIDDRNCTACGICVSVCPTAAITHARDGDRYALSFGPSECTNCRLCVEVCPESALGFEDSLELAEVLSGGPRTLAELRLDDCAICGDQIPSGHGDICTTCDRRGVSATTAYFAGTNSTGL